MSVGERAGSIADTRKGTPLYISTEPALNLICFGGCTGWSALQPAAMWCSDQGPTPHPRVAPAAAQLQRTPPALLEVRVPQRRRPLSGGKAAAEGWRACCSAFAAAAAGIKAQAHARGEVCTHPCWVPGAPRDIGGSPVLVAVCPAGARRVAALIIIAGTPALAIGSVRQRNARHPVNARPQLGDRARTGARRGAPRGAPRGAVSVCVPALFARVIVCFWKRGVLRACRRRAWRQLERGGRVASRRGRLLHRRHACPPL